MRLLDEPVKFPCVRPFSQDLFGSVVIFHGVLDIRFAAQFQQAVASALVSFDVGRVVNDGSVAVLSCFRKFSQPIKARGIAVIMD